MADSCTQVKSLLSQLQPLLPPALVVLGLPPTQRKPDEGFALSADLLNRRRSKTLVRSGQNDEDNACHARPWGDVDFIAKPAEPAKIKQALLNALHFAPAEAVIPPADVPAEDDVIIGMSYAIDRLRQQIRLGANAPFPVLIEGNQAIARRWWRRV